MLGTVQMSQCRVSQCCICSQIFKEDGTTFKLHNSRTANCVICLLWSEGVKTSEPYRRMTTQYGEHYMAQKMYKRGWTDLNAK
jgi:hypothetical protein